MTVKQFRKKPVVIEAMQFLWEEPNRTNAQAIVDWVTFYEHSASLPGPVLRWLTIHTLEGEMTAHPNDWIIKGVQGEFYPCKPDIFEATYEAVDAS